MPWHPTNADLHADTLGHTNTYVHTQSDSSAVEHADQHANATARDDYLRQSQHQRAE